MKITLVYRFFSPDTAPYGLLLEKMLPAIVDAGHEVKVIAGQPSYGADARGKKMPKRTVQFGCDVHRVSLLPAKLPASNLVNLILFSCLSFFKILFSQKRDLYWVGTSPPLVLALLVLAAAKLKGGKLLYQMQDIYPEIAINADLMNKGFISGLLVKIDNFIIRNSDEVVLLSKDMKQYVEKRAGVGANIINNFALGVPEKLPTKTAKKNTKIKIVFAGNIGNFQNLEKLLSAFMKVNLQNIELHFLGAGKAESKLKKQVEQASASNVYFHGRVSPNQAFEFMSECDIGLVSLKPGLFELAYPTKTHTYFAAGLNVFAFLEEESELAQTIEKYDIGASGDWSKNENFVADALTKLIVKTAKKNKSGGIPKEIWHHDSANKKWIELLARIESSA